MYFGENQLSPRSIGISPLPTAHPRHLQLTWVQTSTDCYVRFILAMGSSRGFGSTTTNLVSPWERHALFRLALALAAVLRTLAAPAVVTRRFILQ